jgi:hypothetical protein
MKKYIDLGKIIKEFRRKSEYKYIIIGIGLIILFIITLMVIPEQTVGEEKAKESISYLPYLSILFVLPLGCSILKNGIEVSYSIKINNRIFIV